MIVTTLGEQVVAITRVYTGEKWCKVVLEDGNVEWIRSADLAEEEI
jgi:hypothetical protein